jgi:hypothetical protein
MTKRRMPKRCEEKVVKPREFVASGCGRFHAVDELLEELLLGIGIDELARRRDVLRFDDAPRIERERAKIKFFRALRPDTA